MYLMYLTNYYCRYLFHTVRITVRYVPAPVTGTVFAGMGTVWKIPTRGIPVPNPKDEYSMNGKGNEQADKGSLDRPQMSSHRL